jgi:hypothetical protein
MMRNKDIELEVGEVKREWMVATFSTIEELRGGRAVWRCLTHGWVAVEERFNVEFRGIKHADDDSVARCECGRVIS